VIENALKKAFAPEFLNRIDDVVIFNALEREDIHKIIDIELEKLFVRIKDLGYDLELTKEAKDFISDKGFDQQYGARPLKRAIQKYVEDALAEEIITSKIEEGDKVVMDLDKEKSELIIDVKKSEAKTEES
jgi:ATP-dependent Clp protease ATP-binding subunit ClpC